MIEQVRIRNLGVISDAVLDLAPGLNVLTGETGAGKTMVFRGLNLVFGGKGDSNVISHGADQALVEIDAQVSPEIAATVDELGGAVEDGVLIVSRQLNRTGRSRSFVGGASVPAATVTEIGSQLVAVHGQSDQLRLTKPAQQRHILDRFAGDSGPLTAYQELWERASDLRARIAALTTDSASRERELERIRGIVEKFDALAPNAGEDRDLDDESRRLANAESLHAAASAAASAIDGDDEVAGAVSQLSQARRALEREAAHDSALAALAERVREVEVLAGDVAFEVSAYVAGIDASPQRLEYVENRRAALRSLSREFGDVDALISWVSTQRPRMAELAGGDEVIEALRSDLAELTDRLVEAAARLTAQRTVAASEFATAVSAELEGLAMAGARVEFTITPDEPGPFGADRIELGLRSRPNAPLVALGKGASGGELSRIMLAVEVVLAAADPIGTFIFDEVDAGVGGAAAVEIGRRLARLARSAQVIVVTHLPQVAAFADRHLVVSRGGDEQLHASAIHEVADADRVTEISRMLAGLADSAAGTQLAAELIGLAAAERNTHLPAS